MTTPHTGVTPDTNTTGASGGAASGMTYVDLDASAVTLDDRPVPVSVEDRLTRVEERLDRVAPVDPDTSAHLAPDYREPVE
jgi:hypothetical protein